MSRVTLHAIKVATASEDESGVLVFVDDKLVAVLVHLAARFHGEIRGHWFAEAGFGPCGGVIPPNFPVLNDALSWIAECVGISDDEIYATVSQQPVELRAVYN
jgi:hypothetical protein